MSPWRPGLLCLHDMGWIHSARSMTSEPIGSPDRLRWVVERLLLWAQEAASGAWFDDGSPFEIPEFATSDAKAPPFLYLEDSITYREWTPHIGKFGVFDIHSWGRSYLLGKFRHAKDGVLNSPAWSSAAGRPVSLGIWALIPHVPVISPWKAPMTGAELDAMLGAYGLSFDVLVKSRGFRDALKSGTIIFAIGFPVPQRHGDAPDRIAWRVIVEKPAMHRSVRRHPVPNFSTLKDWWSRADRRVSWQPTENASLSRFESRGLLNASFRGRRVALIGCGSLGSQLAETLVRGGVASLILIDSQDFAVANLVRHTLTSTGLGTSKAEALSARLATISPTCRIETLRCDVQQAMSRLEDAEVVVDATGSDDAQATLARHIGKTPRWFVSMSFTAGVTRGYLSLHYGTNFDAETLSIGWAESGSALGPISSEHDLPREDVGCWHEVFPARNSQVALMGNMLIEDAQREMARMGSGTALLVRYHQGLDHVAGAEDWRLWAWHPSHGG